MKENMNASILDFQIGLLNELASVSILLGLDLLLVYANEL